MSVVEKILAVNELQTALFSKPVRRRKILQVADKVASTIALTNPLEAEALQVGITRNHGCESMLPLINAYGLIANTQWSFNVGDYDDSLSFNAIPIDSVCHLIWYDFSRVSVNLGYTELAMWLEGRLQFLSDNYPGAIVLAAYNLTDPQRSEIELVCARKKIAFYDLNQACQRFDIQVSDPRMINFAGSTVSNAAQYQAAKDLAIEFFYTASKGPLKAVIVDLDNTLYNGVLGEEGINGVKLNKYHIDLQAMLSELAGKGIFICACSKNIEEDVKKLFETRKDFPLSWYDFAITKISWEKKHIAISDILKKLNILPSSVLFIDDNNGELFDVAVHHPEIHLCFASSNTEVTASAINFFPGLWPSKTLPDDLKRVADFKSNEKRDQIFLSSGTIEQYATEIGLKISINYDNADHIERAADLCLKTNQFNLALRRTQLPHLDEYLLDPAKQLVTVSFTDQLNDSGVIGVLLLEERNRCLWVVELCISCRALGRGLETSAIVKGVSSSNLFTTAEILKFSATEGPRNAPALDWVTNLGLATERDNCYVLDASSFSNVEILDDKFYSIGY